MNPQRIACLGAVVVATLCVMGCNKARADKKDDKKETKDDAKAKDLEKQLRERLQAHFEIRQQIRERELAKLEKQIVELREKYEAKKKNKDEAIEKRYTELTGKSDRTEW